MCSVPCLPPAGCCAALWPPAASHPQPDHPGWSAPGGVEHTRLQHRPDRGGSHGLQCHAGAAGPWGLCTLGEGEPGAGTVLQGEGAGGKRLQGLCLCVWGGGGGRVVVVVGGGAQ